MNFCYKLYLGNSYTVLLQHFKKMRSSKTPRGWPLGHIYFRPTLLFFSFSFSHLVLLWLLVLFYSSFSHLEVLGVTQMQDIIIIIIIKRGWQCKAGRERLTPYQSEDPNQIGRASCRERVCQYV